MAKNLLIAVIVVWVVGVVLSLAGGIGHLIVLAFVALLLAGIMTPQRNRGERRIDRF